ncbi:hypothetical protein [Wolbachia endosymbiont (group A) of Brachyopa scutellaris]|uniref:hypothetical protein n=1 Tax=Wolbachia endosymbiont (group A) of Brachyopa scutellaris TaxID=3066140 RepID=UPI003132F372
MIQKSIANPRKVSLRHTAIHSIAVRTLSSRRVSSQRPYDVIPVLDTGIQEF